MSNPMEHYRIYLEESRRLQRAGVCAWRVFDLLKRAMLKSAARGASGEGRRLFEGELSVKDIASLTGLSQRGVRNGLRELEESGLIRIKRGRAGNGYELVHAGPTVPEGFRQAMLQNQQVVATALAAARGR